MRQIFTKITACVLLSLMMYQSSMAQNFLLQEDFEGAFPPANWSFYTPSAEFADGWSYGRQPSPSLLSNVCVPEGNRTMVSQWATFYPNNTWAFTPGLTLTSGKTYIFSFRQCVQSTNSNKTESMKITVGRQATEAEQTTTILSLPTLTNTSTITRVASFTPTTSGLYYFGINCYSAPNQRYLSVDSVSVYTDEATSTFPAPYCEASFPVGIAPITYVGFSTIHHASSATSTVAHEDKTYYIGEIQTNKSYTIITTGNTNGDHKVYYHAYIDWNQDNDFDDAGESYPIGSIQNSTGVDSLYASTIINVPSTATLGRTRMRVLSKFESDSISPCNNDSVGQAEDYTLDVFGVTLVDVTAPNNPAIAYITTYHGTVQLSVNVYSSTMSQGVIWTIVNESGEATVDNNGLVTAVNNGNVWVIATSLADSTKKDSIQITIINQQLTSVRNSSISNDELNAFPNPTIHSLVLSTKKNHPALNIAVNDVTGKMIQRIAVDANTLKDQYSLDVSGLAQGLYFIEITGKDVFVTKKIVKQ